MKILSRNLNGIRAVLKKGLIDFLQKESPDIFCVQETKAFEDQLPVSLTDRLTENDYDRCRHDGTRAGYAGTAIFWKKSVLGEVVATSAFENDKFHEDGRITQVDFTLADQKISLLNGYFPNGGTRADGTEMLSYKLAFYDELIAYINDLQSQGKQVIVLGDYNICHTRIDIARPDANENSIGFLPIEREKVSEYLDKTGTIDVFRHFHPDLTDEYTWRSYRGGARSRNVGRRIDYVTVSEPLVDHIESFRHRQEVMGSDHCPVEIVLQYS